MFLGAAEVLIQRQFRRVERLNGLDAQVRHAGIKPRISGNEKRGEKPRLADSLLATAQTIFGKVMP
jgi:hypothetical protein